MRILWLTLDHSMRVMDLFSPFRNAVARQPGIEVEVLMRDLGGKRAGAVCREIWYNRREPFPPCLTDPDWVNSEFDLVMIDGVWLYMSEPWDKVKIPIGTTWGDNHGSMVEEYLGVAHDKIDLFFPMLWESFGLLHGETFQDRRVQWMPWSFDPSVFKDYGEPKQYGVLTTGAMSSPVYRVRTSIYDAGAPYDTSGRVHIGQGGFANIPRPVEDESGNQWPTYEEYARFLNGSWMCGSCSGSWRYALAKTFEIPAAHSVLFSDLCEDAKALGHVDGETMLVADPPNIRETVDFWLERPDQLSKIAENGHYLMHTQHTNDVRAAEFVAHLGELI